MTNVIDAIINYTLRSKYNSLNKIGNTLYVNRRMISDRENFITEGFTATSKMQDVLMEMKLLMSGRYAGNKEYLFGRMGYLIDCGFRIQNKSKRRSAKIINRSEKQNRCKRTGKFVALKKRK